jgi:hypothetical protein
VPKTRFRFAVAATSIAILTWSVTAAGVAAAAAPGPDAGGTPVPGVAGLNGIGCPTSKTCVTVGLDESLNGKSAVISTATGKVHTWSGDLASHGLNAIACPGKSSCLAVADAAVATVNTSSGAMKVTATLKPPTDAIVAIGAIACASSSSCYAVGFQGTEVTSQALVLRLAASGKLLKKMVDTGTGISAIACPSSKLCLLADHTKAKESIQLLSNGHFGTSHAFPADTYISQVTCFQAKACFALGGSTSSETAATNELFPLNPKTGAIGHVVKTGTFSGNGMACASATRCLIVGFTTSGSTTAPALVTVTRGKPGHPAKIGAAADGFAEVACASATDCYAAGLSRSGAIVLKV